MDDDDEDKEEEEMVGNWNHVRIVRNNRFTFCRIETEDDEEEEDNRNGSDRVVPQYGISSENCSISAR